MALRISLETGKKIIVNGAVIENTGNATITLKIHNKANLLRGSEVLAEADSCTPARRLYYALQCAYLFEANRGEYLARFDHFLDDYVGAAPSAQELAARTRKLVAAEDYYAALKAARGFMKHEDERLAVPSPTAESVKEYANESSR